MDTPLRYQISEYDCVPTTFINAIAYLFDRRSVPPLVVRYIYAYSLDTVSRGGRLGRGGTSKYAIQLLGNWLGSYKTPRFSVTTEYLAVADIHAGPGNRIVAALDEGAVALGNVHLGHGEWHFLLILRADDEWIYCFDPYRRVLLRGLRRRVVLLPGGLREPNLKIHRRWLDEAAPDGRFSWGEREQRECLLVRRVR